MAALQRGKAATTMSTWCASRTPKGRQTKLPGFAGLRGTLYTTGPVFPGLRRRLPLRPKPCKPPPGCPARSWAPSVRFSNSARRRSVAFFRNNGGEGLFLTRYLALFQVAIAALRETLPKGRGSGLLSPRFRFANSTRRPSLTFRRKLRRIAAQSAPGRCSGETLHRGMEVVLRQILRTPCRRHASRVRATALACHVQAGRTTNHAYIISCAVVRYNAQMMPL
jgi:hypothetical protein